MFYTWTKCFIHGEIKPFLHAENVLFTEKMFFTWIKCFIHEEKILYVEKSFIHGKNVLYVEDVLNQIKQFMLLAQNVSSMEKKFYTWRKCLIHGENVLYTDKIFSPHKNIFSTSVQCFLHI